MNHTESECTYCNRFGQKCLPDDCNVKVNPSALTNFNLQESACSDVHQCNRMYKCLIFPALAYLSALQKQARKWLSANLALLQGL